MEPQYRHLVVGIVPVPRQFPPQPFQQDDLQRLFTDMTKEVSYQQFQFLPGGAGAQIFNAPDDLVMVQPGLIQARRPIESTPQRAREDLTGVLRAAERRLGLQQYAQVGIKVVAHLPAPGATPDAKTFIAERLLHQGSEAVSELGPSFFAGGVKYRSIDPAPGGQGQREEVLLVEPFVADNTYLFLDYDVQIAEMFNGLERVVMWIDEAFDFVRGPAMRILEA